MKNKIFLNKRSIYILGIIASLIVCKPGLTEESGVYSDKFSRLTLNGFGTLAASIDDRIDMMPQRNVSQLFYNQFESNLNAELDSRLGLQAHYRAGRNLDFVVQGVLRNQVSVDLENSIELGYAAFRPSHWVEFRFGRVGYDAFLMADKRQIGYAYPWVRPPIEFYGWLPLYHMDGMDMTWRIDREESQWSIRLQGAQTVVPIYADSTFDIDCRDIYTASITRQSGPLQIKGSISSYRISNEMPALIPLQEGLNSIATEIETIFPSISHEAESLYHNLTFSGAEMCYSSIGFSYDDGKWFTQAELAYADTSSDIFTNGIMGYAAVARRFGDWMPYVIYSAIIQGNDVSTPEEDWSPVGASELQTAANETLNIFRMEQRTLSLGLRWDFNLQSAIKLQWDIIRTDAFGHGLWFTRGDLKNQDNSIGMGTISLDFMF